MVPPSGDDPPGSFSQGEILFPTGVRSDDHASASPALPGSAAAPASSSPIRARCDESRGPGPPQRDGPVADQRDASGPGTSRGLGGAGPKRVREVTAPGWHEFWTAYPHKIGKHAAERAYRRALASTSPSELRAGLRRYLETKPVERPWCNPATWLNQGRWLDEPAEQPELLMPIHGGRGHGPHQPAATSELYFGAMLAADAVAA